MGAYSDVAVPFRRENAVRDDTRRRNSVGVTHIARLGFNTVKEFSRDDAYNSFLTFPAR